MSTQPNIAVRQDRDATSARSQPDIGHNSGINVAAADQLRSFVGRIEAMEEAKASIAGDIKVLFAEAKSTGHDTKVLKKLIALRKKDPTERANEEAVLATYMHALGMDQ